MKKIFVSALAFLTLINVAQADPKFPLTKQELLQSVLKDMVFVQGGTFHMGHTPKNVQVTLTSYYLDKYAVPYYQYKSYERLIGRKVNQTSVEKEAILNGLYPAQETYKEASHFCRWLGKQIGFPMSLPTEAQWEYAARSRGKNVMYATNNGKLEPGKNFPDPKHFILYNKVNAFPPNPLGMYLMNGNGGEWTKDWYGALPRRSVTNPQGPKTGSSKALRGTGISDVMTAFDPKTSEWNRRFHLTALNIYNRTWMQPDKRTKFNFRCVINSGKPLPKI